MTERQTKNKENFFFDSVFDILLVQKCTNIKFCAKNDNLRLNASLKWIRFCAILNTFYQINWDSKFLMSDSRESDFFVFFKTFYDMIIF